MSPVDWCPTVDLAALGFPLGTEAEIGDIVLNIDPQSTRKFGEVTVAFSFNRQVRVRWFDGLARPEEQAHRNELVVWQRRTARILDALEGEPAKEALG